MTLTEVNYYTKKLAPIAIIFLLIIVALFFAVRLLFLYSQTQNPTVKQSIKIQLDTKFNKIKSPQIAETGSSKNFTYTIDTLDGTDNIENATSAASVFFLPKRSATFGFLTQIYAMAKAIHFDTEVTKHTLNGRTAEFNDGRKKLLIDIDTFNYSYEYSLDKDDELFKGDIQLNPTSAESVATGFLNDIGNYSQELSQGKRNTIYLKYDQATRQITPLNSEEGANMIEIDFYRPDVDGYPTVSSSYYNSPNYVIMAPKNGQLEIIRAQMRFYERSPDQIGVYPIRSNDQAWEDLKGGKGMVIHSDHQNGQIKIKKIFLAYFDPELYQEYMQPVYVFLGDGFVAYIPAVTDEFLAAP